MISGVLFDVIGNILDCLELYRVLVGNNIRRIRAAFNKEMKAKRRPMRPEKWDGKTAERIAKEIVKFEV